MRKVITILLIFICFACKAEFPPVLESSGVVSFRFNTIDFKSNQSFAVSDWTHILPDSVQISITNRNTGSQIIKWLYTTKDNDIVLSNGSYIFTGQSSGADYSDFLPINFAGAFAVRGKAVNVNIQGNTDHALLTLDPELIGTVTIGGNSMNMVNGYYYKYIKGNMLTVLGISEDVYQDEIIQEISITPRNHFHYKLEIAPGEQSANINLNMAPFTYSSKTIMISLRKTYDVLAGKLVTLIAEPFEGFSFSHWVMDGEFLSEENNYSFNMPDRDINITGHFTKN